MVSIIIPIYNGEKYIKKLYESLSKQTYQDYEIVYVNDGSHDESLNILKEIAEKDSKVRFFSQKNKGICASRNLGIRNAKGNYLIFLDQDDSIELNLVEKYVQAMNEDDVDMAVFGKIHYFITDGKIEHKVYQRFDNEIVDDRKKIYDYLFNVDNRKRLSTVWNCIYRKDVLINNNIFFDEYFKRGDEDGMFNIEYVLNCKKIRFSDECYYHYYIRKNISTITKVNYNLLNDFLHFIDKLNSLTAGIEDVYVKNMIRLYILRFYSNVYKRFCRFNNKFFDKIKFIKDTKKSLTFNDALMYSNRKYSNIVGKKYFFWDVFNHFCKKDYYTISVLLLDIIRKLKKV